MDLLLVALAVVCLASIGRGGRAHFKAPKTERGKQYLADRARGVPPDEMKKRYGRV